MHVALEECEGCEEEWFQDDPVDSWFWNFKDYIYYGLCSVYAGDAEWETPVPKDKFYPCFRQFASDPKYQSNLKHIAFNDDNSIKGFRFFVDVAKMENSSVEGPKYLDDIHGITKKYAVGETYAFNSAMLDFERDAVFIGETILSICLSTATVFAVVLLITGSVSVTILVVMAVVLVDVYLLALVHYWDLSLNTFVVVFLIIGLGLSVDYSAHIAHTYLIVPTPATMTTMEKRMHKARVAISQMGSSVIHGGTSTLLAVIVLGGARSYIFTAFFRVFFGIVVFGMSNGFILLPIILSLIGPTPDPLIKHEETKRRMSLSSTAKDEKDQGFKRRNSLRTDIRKVHKEMGLDFGDAPDKTVELDNIEVNAKPS